MNVYEITLVTECNDILELDRLLTRLDKIVPQQVKHISFVEGESKDWRVNKKQQGIRPQKPFFIYCPRCNDIREYIQCPCNHGECIVHKKKAGNWEWMCSVCSDTSGYELYNTKSMNENKSMQMSYNKFDNCTCARCVAAMSGGMTSEETR